MAWNLKSKSFPWKYFEKFQIEKSFLITFSAFFYVLQVIKKLKKQIELESVSTLIAFEINFYVNQLIKMFVDNVEQILTDVKSGKVIS